MILGKKSVSSLTFRDELVRAQTIRTLESYCGERSKAKLSDLYYPTDTEENKKTMIGQSSCGLLVTGGWWHNGLRHELIKKPYIGRSDAFSRIEVIAREMGAFTDWQRSEENVFDLAEGGHLIGSSLMIGADGTTWGGGPGHILTVYDLSFSPDKKIITIHSIDGGQIDPETKEKGSHFVKKVKRTLKKKGRCIYLSDSIFDRRLYGIIDTTELHFSDEVKEILLC